MLAATSRELRCQCPIVTPASFGGSACARTGPEPNPGNAPVTSHNAIVIAFIVDSLLRRISHSCR